MTSLYLDIDEYVELTEEEAVDIALRKLPPPPEETYIWIESESNQRITDNRKYNRKRSTLIQKCLG